MPNRNDVLNARKREAKDEFYTLYADVEREMAHYDFNGMAVYCNCDSKDSAFWLYFLSSFEKLGLKGLYRTSYEPNGGACLSYAEMVNGDVTVTDAPLHGNGDFRSDECLAIMDKADIVVTNPPFSLWRELFSTIIGHGKDFLLLGTLNALKYRTVVPYTVGERLYVGGAPSSMWFRVPDDDFGSGPRFKIEDGVHYRSITNACWIATITSDYYPKKPIPLLSEYSAQRYPKYDNRDAVNVNSYKDIPRDWFGEIGVPLSYLPHHCREQFEITAIGYGDDGKHLAVNGATPYERVLIRRRRG